MHLHLDPLGGLAGDMFCAALLDLRPELIDGLRATLDSLAMPVPVTITLEEAGGPLRGKRFRVRPAEPPHHHHHHTPFRRIRELLEGAPINGGVRDRALAIFTLLAEAEGRVHGVAPEAVEFHEVGSWDSIGDIVGAAYLIEALGIVSASTAPLPLGGGSVQTAHGRLPVPAPATAYLLEGLPLRDDGIPGERVTPTGAAILRALTPTAALPEGLRLRGSGRGFGSRTLEGVPNCLQVLWLEGDGEPAAAGFRPEGDHVVALRFEVDDQSPEDFALAMDHLRAAPGALSVTTWMAIGKGGRPTLAVELLAEPERAAELAAACFRETTTIGLRRQPLSRWLLPRQAWRVELEEGALDVKVVQRPHAVTAKVENRDLAGHDSHSEREALRRLGSDAVLEGGADDDHE